MTIKIFEDEALARREDEVSSKLEVYVDKSTGFVEFVISYIFDIDEGDVDESYYVLTAKKAVELAKKILETFKVENDGN